MMGMAMTTNKFHPPMVGMILPMGAPTVFEAFDLATFSKVMAWMILLAVVVMQLVMVMPAHLMATAFEIVLRSGLSRLTRRMLLVMQMPLARIAANIRGRAGMVDVLRRRAKRVLVRPYSPALGEGVFDVLPSRAKRGTASVHPIGASTRLQARNLAASLAMSTAAMLGALLTGFLLHIGALA